MSELRTERDSMGEVEVPAGALYRAQTQRAVDNFRIGGGPMPHAFIRALGLVKASAAEANAALGLLPADIAAAIVDAALQIADGGHRDMFPVDVYPTGSGTSTNMNANEVIATLATGALGAPVHPNDHVNCSQSSNDVIPTTIHVSAELALGQGLAPAIDHLRSVIAARERGLADSVKTGRTHLMDAMPITLAQELSGWRAQVENARDGIGAARSGLLALAQGGTAVGTGVNADPRFATLFCEALNRRTGLAFAPARNHFAAIASQDTAVAVSGQLRVLAVALTKISNDLRWMGSGPLAGLGEIRLKSLQPGSSIMPGKTNPVVPEAVLMAMAKIVGNDATIALAGQSGNFQLNVMLPVIADSLLENIGLLERSCMALADQCIAEFTVDEAAIARNLARNPILATALTQHIGYDQAAKIAGIAYAQQREILDVAAQETDIDRATLAELLDPRKLV